MISINDIYSALHSRAYKPRFHGNGFIQLQVNQMQRLHVWNDMLVPAPPENFSTIHNHVWDMESEVMMGDILHIVYDREEENTPDKDTHNAAHVNTKTGQIDVSPIGGAVLWEDGRYNMTAGSSYRFPAFKLHETRAKFAMTLMSKKDVHDDWATILTPIDKTFFDAHAAVIQPEEKILWYGIYNALVFTDGATLNRLGKVLGI